MAKIVGKGTVLQQTIAMSLVDIAQVIGVEYSGGASETYDGTSLDTSGAGREMPVTSVATPGAFDFDMFFDPALAGHQFITDEITTPAENASKLIFADSGTTEWPFTRSGISLGLTVALDDGVKARCSFQCTGLPTFAT